MEVWTVEQQKIRDDIAALKDKIAKEYGYLDKITDEVSNRVDNHHFQIAQIQANCPHIDDGGMFHFGCKVCGYMDF